MPKVRASSGMIGTIRWPSPLSRSRLRSITANAMVVDTDRLPEPASNSARVLSAGAGSGLARTTRWGSEPFRARRRSIMYWYSTESGGGRVEGRLALLQGRVGDLVLQVQAVPQQLELGRGHLLDLVGGVAGLDLGPERPALDGLGQDHRRLAGRLGGGLVGGVQLAVVVAAAGQVAQVVVGEVLDQRPQPGVGAEEVLPDVGAVLGGVLLELAVDGGVHLVEQHAVDVAGQQLVPLPAPHHLDDVPAGAAEGGLELLDDLAVAADRAVEALQVAVDDEDQVVELLAAGQRQGAERLGLVALAVAEEAPHPALRGVGDPPVVQVPVEVGLVDGVERPEPHRHGRELPEVGHQPGVGVRRQAARARPGAPAAPGGSSSAGPRSAGPP